MRHVTELIVCQVFRHPMLVTTDYSVFVCQVPLRLAAIVRVPTRPHCTSSRSRSLGQLLSWF